MAYSRRHEMRCTRYTLDKTDEIQDNGKGCALKTSRKIRRVYRKVQLNLS
jgi:hypothetical protein